MKINKPIFITKNLKSGILMFYGFPNIHDKFKEKVFVHVSLFMKFC